MVIFSEDDRLFVDRIRGLSIMRVVLVHLGLAWIYPPYTRFIHAFLPLLFFVSGVVSYGSYTRSVNMKAFLKKRITSLLIPYYVFIVFVFLFYLYENGFNVKISPSVAFLWLTLAPPHKTMPFPLGQVWFIHALLIIVIISPLVYKAADKMKIFIFSPMVFSLILSTWQIYEPISKKFNVFDHNLYQPLVNCAFFFLGSSYFIYFKYIDKKKLIIFSVFNLVFAIFFFLVFNLPLDFSEHVYAPNIYYMTVSFFCISITLLVKQQINIFLNKIGLIDGMVMFFNKNAYAIFLNHSFFVFVTEKWFGLSGVMGNPILALIKIIFVFLLSVMFAIPITFAVKNTKLFGNKIFA